MIGAVTQAPGLNDNAEPPVVLLWQSFKSTMNIFMVDSFFGIIRTTHIFQSFNAIYSALNATLALNNDIVLNVNFRSSYAVDGEDN